MLTERHNANSIIRPRYRYRWLWTSLSIVFGCSGAAERSDAVSDGTNVGPWETTGTPVSDGVNTAVTTAESGRSAEESDGFLFDVGSNGDVDFCETREPGIYCVGQQAIECGAGGMQLAKDSCGAGTCEVGEGCIVCVAGQYTCLADKVLECDVSVDPAAWKVREVCDPEAGEGCDLELGACQVLEPVGTTDPSGRYYQFAQFERSSSVFQGGADVDGWGNRIYVLRGEGQFAIDVYEIALLDSDGDGELEPNQHPDNADEPGPIEERTLTFIETLPAFGDPFFASSELFVLSDRMFIGGFQLAERIFGGATSVVTMPPEWDSFGTLSQIGYDDVRHVWYASNESQRRVLQYDPVGDAWGIAFLFPALQGDHMDGLEVVMDPNTGTSYVYVSDMTSDYIGQYRLDPQHGWVQANLFAYDGPVGAAVEGMGFGPLNHFWATSLDMVYELGGGELSAFTEPAG